jgi:Protein of unknown function (DUF2510)
MAVTPPAPGWYTDPWNPAYQRYWDGHDWTVMTRATAPHSETSESNQIHGKSATSNRSWIKTLADWFNTGTAAVKFAKALFGLLAFLGIITIGGAIAGGGSGGGGNNLTPANLSTALLQPSDLGATGAVGWSKTQAPSSSSTPPCPTFPRNSEGHVFTALTYGSMGIVLYEDVWKLASPDQAISTFVNTAQGCSFTNASGNTVTLQADDSDGSYGNESVIYTVGVTSPGFQNETPTLGAYNALIARGHLLAAVYLSTGTEGTLSQSMLSTVFGAAAKRLLPSTLY